MQRLTGVVVSLIFVATAFLYVWRINPLYAFIAGVVLIVFLIAAYGLFKTLFQEKTNSAIDPYQHVLPRRTGEFRQLEDVERPEGSWEDLNTPAPPTLVSIPDDDEKSDHKKKLEEPSLEPVPVAKPEAPRRTQVLYSVVEDNDEEKLAIEDLNKAINSGSSHPSAGSPPEDTEAENELVIDDVTNSRLLVGVQELGHITETVQDGDDSGASPAELDKQDIPDWLPSGAGQNSDAIDQDIFDLEEETTEKANVSQFTAYYPRQADAGTEYGFYVYAHLPDALINSDIQQFEKNLGGRVPKAKVSEQQAELKTGTALSVMIECDQLKFNQIGAIQKWKAPFVRFDFDFIAHKALVDEVVEGRIAIFLGMIEIASIDFQILVAPAKSEPIAIVRPENPINADDYDATESATIYQSIFISYSHKDTAIAEQYRKAQMMLGNTIFMDTHSIRVGDDWEDALKTFIDSADVFQLFWSEHSASSEHVRFEWDYALSHRCPETQCTRYIRPVYWQKPLANIPLELGHLHFSFVDMKMVQ